MPGFLSNSRGLAGDMADSHIAGVCMKGGPYPGRAAQWDAPCRACAAPCWFADSDGLNPGSDLHALRRPHKGRRRK